MLSQLTRKSNAPGIPGALIFNKSEVINMGQELNISKTVTLPTSSQVLSQEQFKEQAQRIFFSIINTSPGAEKVSIAFNEEAKNGQGIVLSPGGSYSESSDGINNATNAQINVVGSAATATIAYSERIITRGF